MIVLDDQEPGSSTSTKAQQAEQEHRAPTEYEGSASEETPLLPPPPAYSSTAPYNHAVISPLGVPPPAPDGHGKRGSGRRARWRFFGAFVIALTVVLSVKGLVQALWSWKLNQHRNSRNGAVEPPTTWPHEDDDGIPAQYCVKTSQFSRSTSDGHLQHTFVLSSNATSLLFLSRGEGLFGELEMVTADGMEKPESVLFHIKAPSSEEGTSALHSACLLREVGGGTGVRLVAAPHINVSSAARQPIRLRVAIPFDPQAYSRGYALRTVLPSFTHNVAISIYTGTTFSTFSLSSSDAPIRVSGVNTETLRLNTSHAPITLVQSAISGTAELTNHNGSILVGNATGLHNLEHQKTASRLIMRTTDAPLNATIHLVASPYHIPSFSLHARTSGPDAPLFFDVPSMSTTLMSTVALSANTDGAPATVELPPAFEGQFVVRGAVPAVFVRKDPEDPYGLRRTRKTTVSMVGENGMIATGSARWYPKHPLAGDVSVEDGFVNVTAVGSAASLNL